MHSLLICEILLILHLEKRSPHMLRQWKYWPPVFYTLVWIIGFLIGIFGILPNVEGPLKLVIAAFTTYLIFLVNAFIDFRLYLYSNNQYKTRAMVIWVVGLIALLCFGSIILSHFYVITANMTLFELASLIMIFSFFAMEMVKHNPRICFIIPTGSDFRPNIRR